MASQNQNDSWPLSDVLTQLLASPSLSPRHSGADGISDVEAGGSGTARDPAAPAEGDEPAGASSSFGNASRTAALRLISRLSHRPNSGSELGQLDGSTGGRAAALGAMAAEADPLPPGESTAAAAERHRLTSARGALDLGALASWLEATSLYWALLGFVFVQRFCLALLQVAWLAVALSRVNAILRRQVALRGDAQAAEVAGAAAYVAANCLVLSWLLEPESLVFRALSLSLPPQPSPGLSPTSRQPPLGFFDVIFAVLVADSLARLATFLPKLAVVAACQAQHTLLPRWAASRGDGGSGAASGRLVSRLLMAVRGGGSGSSVSAPVNGGSSGSASSSSNSGSPAAAALRAHRRQARLLTLVEYGSQLYRQLVPVPLWYSYLLHHVSSHPVVCSALTGSYLALKGAALWRAWQLFALAARGALARGALYGKYVATTPAAAVDASATAAAASGCEPGVGGAGTASAASCCPICQDPIRSGVSLAVCGHVFCEECISEWLERDRTCPMCRRDVKPPGLTSCGDGTVSLLPQLF